MNILFNEISARTAPIDLVSAIQLLVDDLGFLASLSAQRPIYHAGHYSRLTDFFFGIKGSLQVAAFAHADQEIRGIILSFLGATNELVDAPPISHHELTSNEGVSYIQSYIDRFGESGISISIKENDNWKDWELRFQSVNSSKTITSIPHIGAPLPLFSSYIQGLEKFLLPLARADDRAASKSEHLPNSKYSSILLDRADFATKNSAGMSEKIAIFSIVGGAVARINGYEQMPDIERKNSTKEKLRKIFFNANLKKYLSIDFMHGAYEVCGDNGAHIEEINFAGENLSGRQPDHSIQL